MRAFLLALVTLTSLSSGAADKKWPFDQAPNVAVLTQKQVIREKAPILLVSHDADDHGWQFLNPSIPATVENAAVVGLGQIVQLDPSLVEISDLPVGWRAQREKVGAKWRREMRSK